MSDASKVREFNLAAGQACPDKPEAMTAEDVGFLVKMMVDEIMELLATHHEPQDAKDILLRTVMESKEVPKEVYGPEGPAAVDKQIADQADALVDVYYYMLNAACKRGMNLSKVFDLVHAANMAKRDPATGVFLKREDGKIIKPEGWKEPNVALEMARQRLRGTYSE